ncbi:hypothetical protein [Suttonella indologenes]|nr:hypothetical protein [Suttonella indologenes]
MACLKSSKAQKPCVFTGQLAISKVTRCGGLLSLSACAWRSCSVLW